MVTKHELDTNRFILFQKPNLIICWHKINQGQQGWAEQREAQHLNLYVLLDCNVFSDLEFLIIIIFIYGVFCNFRYDVGLRKLSTKLVLAQPPTLLVQKLIKVI